MASILLILVESARTEWPLRHRSVILGASSVASSRRRSVRSGASGKSGVLARLSTSSVAIAALKHGEDKDGDKIMDDVTYVERGKRGVARYFCWLLLFFQRILDLMFTMAKNRSQQQANQTNYCLISSSETVSQCQFALADSIFCLGVC